MSSHNKYNDYSSEVFSQEFYTMSQLAKLFQVHRSTISRLLNDGEFAYIQVKNSKRVPVWSVQAFIDKQIESANEVRGE